MSEFGGCTRECPTGSQHFDLTCARREYQDLEHLLGGLDRFFNQGIMPGGFLRAVLSNDLLETFGRVDPQNVTVIPRLLLLLYNHVPSPAWGSPAKVRAWRRTVRGETEPETEGA